MTIAPSSFRRSGFTLLETLVAGVLLLAALTITAAMLSAVLRERRSSENRQRAICEAENVLARLAAYPWTSLTIEGTEAGGAAAELNEILPGAEVRVEIERVPGPPEAKRVGLELRWPDARRRGSRPVRLSTWVYRGGYRGD